MLMIKIYLQSTIGLKLIITKASIKLVKNILTGRKNIKYSIISTLKYSKFNL